MTRLPLLTRLLTQLSRFLRVARETARLMVGQPDYDRYVAHCRAAHPDRPIMDRISFFNERQDHRYAGRGSGRCC